MIPCFLHLAHKGDEDSEAGGEDDDFGDEVRSDDEEEVGKDDANEGGGTLHQVNFCCIPCCEKLCLPAHVVFSLLH